MPDEHIFSRKTYFIIYISLIVLLAVTVAASSFNFGLFDYIIATIIAMAKAALILAYFMHLRHSTTLVWIFAGLGFFWLTVLITLTMADYLTRGGFPGVLG